MHLEAYHLSQWVIDIRTELLTCMQTKSTSGLSMSMYLYELTGMRAHLGNRGVWIGNTCLDRNTCLGGEVARDTRFSCLIPSLPRKDRCVSSK